jgi:hypothetical protein
MSRASNRLLLAVAALAALSATVRADDRLPSEVLPAPTQEKPRTKGDVHDAFNRKSEAPEGKRTDGHTASEDDLPMVSDGWVSPPASDCDEPACCEMCTNEPVKRKIIADVELMAQRTHFSEIPLGKLAEKYELSEKITLGVENPHGIGGRIRYWTYDRTTPNMQGGSDLRVDFDVIDFEGTTRFGNEYFDLTLSGGVRWADIKIDIDQGRTRNDMPGASFGLDLRGLICHDCEKGLDWRSVSGARFSVFGGDWENSHGLIPATRDDNITVMEIYGGVEGTCCCHGRELYARFVMEAQNWRSDALGEAIGIDSMSFIGPGVNLGINY